MSTKDISARSLRLTPRDTSALNLNSGAQGQIFYDISNATLRVGTGGSNSNILATRTWVLNNSYVTNSNLSSTLLSYVTSSNLSSTLLSYVTSSSLSSTLSNYVTTSTLSSNLSNYLPLTGGTINGNLTFSGTARIISGDFSNATASNRVLFQTSTTNANTSIGIIPNGSSTQSGVNIYNSSNASNAGITEILATASEARFNSTISGTGTYLPMTFYTGGSERARIDTSGNIQIGTTTSAGKVTIYDATAATLLLQGDTLTSLIVQRASADTASSTMLLRKARGTIASPVAVLTGDNVGAVNFQAYSGSTHRNVAQILAGVETYVSDTDIAGFLRFSTAPGGGTTVLERMRIDSTGSVLIGTTTNPTSARLAVVATSNPRLLQLISTDVDSSAGIGFSNDGTAWGFGIRGDVSDAIVLRNITSNIDTVTFDTSGNVGIGKTAAASVRLDVNGQINDTAGNVRSVPQNPQTTSYVLAATDNGRHVSITTGGVTIPASVFLAGDAVTIFNNSASSQTITQGANVTLRVAGTAITGTRTLAAFGLVTILCITGGANPTFVISGAGLS